MQFALAGIESKEMETANVHEGLRKAPSRAYPIDESFSQRLCPECYISSLTAGPRGSTLCIFRNVGFILLTTGLVIQLSHMRAIRAQLRKSPRDFGSKRAGAKDFSHAEQSVIGFCSESSPQWLRSTWWWISRFDVHPHD
jgi:hypothetical protein